MGLLSGPPEQNTSFLYPDRWAPWPLGGDFQPVVVRIPCFDASRITSPLTASAGSGSISASRSLTQRLARSLESSTDAQLSNMVIDVITLPLSGQLQSTR